MQILNFVEAVTNIQSQVSNLRDQMSLLEKQVNEADDELSKIVAQHFSVLNAEWNPKIGEQAMYADFLDQVAFSVQVIEIMARNVRARGNSSYNTATYSSALDLAPEDWCTPCLLMPTETFIRYESLFKRVYRADAANNVKSFKKRLL